MINFVINKTYRRGRIAVYCARLESGYVERHRGFESLPLRQESHFEKSRLEVSAQSASETSSPSSVIAWDSVPPITWSMVTQRIMDSVRYKNLYVFAQTAPYAYKSPPFLGDIRLSQGQFLWKSTLAHTFKYLCSQIINTYYKYHLKILP